ncbi:MAG: S9 family peptidase [Acidobacteriaceae bacterium]|nr:S9 family peptidase [Acidobacteriaceae bacterium]
MRHNPVFYFALVACFGASEILTAASGSFTIEQVMSAPFASSPVAAPGGARVAWLLNEQGRRNVWVASAPDWKGRRVTKFDEDDGQEIAELSWAPDGSYLLFTRGGDFETGGDNPNPDLSPTKPEQAIWRVAMDDSAPRKLTEGHAPAVSPKGDVVTFVRAGQIWTMSPTGEDIKNVVTQKGTQRDLEWSPDGSMLAFVSGRHDHSFIALFMPATKTLRYLDASVDDDSDPVWSPDGEHVAYVRVPATGEETLFAPRRQGEPWSIRVTDVKTGTAHEIFRAKRGPGSVFHPLEADHQIFWAAGDHIVFPWEQTGWCHLYSLVATEGGAAVELTPGEGEVEHVSMSHDAKTIFYSTNIADIDRRHLWRVNAAPPGKPEQITTGETIEWAPTPAGDGSALMFLASSYNECAHAMVRGADGKSNPLAPEATPSDFPAAQLVKPQQVILSAADGLQIHGQLFLPKGDSGRHPALIFFHGGSRREMLLGFHYMDYYSNAYAMNQYLANQGYVVLSVNYRSGIGYGLNFREAINYGYRGGSEFNDVMGAGLYLRSRPDVDPKRIGVWGGSYGGYLTAMALSRASDLFAAGVDFHGVHDWSTLHFMNFGAQTADPKLSRERQEAARIAFESSPMASINTWKSPVLLIHGDDDRNVEFSQTVVLVEALRQRNVDFEELIIPNEIHGFLMHRHWVEAYKASADFFARKLRVGPETAETR